MIDVSSAGYSCWSVGLEERRVPGYWPELSESAVFLHDLFARGCVIISSQFESLWLDEACWSPPIGIKYHHSAAGINKQSKKEF